MSRIRTALIALPLAATALVIGAGAASADSIGAFAGGGSSSSIVNDNGTGNLSGWVDGNANWTQQTATGSGASNQNNTLGVKGNSGTVYSDQTNTNVRIIF